MFADNLNAFFSDIRGLPSPKMKLFRSWLLLVVIASLWGFLMSCLGGSALSFFQRGEYSLVSLAIVAAGTWEALRHSKALKPTAAQNYSRTVDSMFVVGVYLFLVGVGFNHGEQATSMNLWQISGSFLALIFAILWSTFLYLEIDVMLHKFQLARSKKS